MAGVFQPNVFQGGGVFQIGTPATQARGGDTSDPQFYDWWRKRAREERQKLEVVKTEVLAPAAEPLREETIAAIEVATSVKEIQSLDLLKYELNIITAAIADYERMVAEDEEEAALLLLMPWQTLKVVKTKPLTPAEDEEEAEFLLLH